jgi:polar amino acid transport system substrate-binding protein
MRGRSVFSASAACAGSLLLCLLVAVPALAKETITLCFERADVPPWRSIKGEGHNFDLLRQVEARLGITFDYQSMPWKRCLAQVRTNEVGGAFAVSFKPDRLEIGAYPGGKTPDASRRLHIDRYMLIRRKGSKVEWDGKALRNLEGTVGVQLGYSVGDFLRGMNVPVDEGSQRATELAQKLVAGRIGAAAMGGGDSVSIMQSPLASQLELLPLPLIEKPYFLLLSHALVTSNPKLAEKIWRTIEEVRNSPAYRKQVGNDGGNH